MDRKGGGPLIRIGAIAGLITGGILTIKHAVDTAKYSGAAGAGASVIESITGFNINSGGWSWKNMRLSLPMGAGIGHSYAYSKLGLNDYLPKGIGG